jgi:hypothetical protein
LFAYQTLTWHPQSEEEKNKINLPIKINSLLYEKVLFNVYIRVKMMKIISTLLTTNVILFSVRDQFASRRTGSAVLKM